MSKSNNLASNVPIVMVTRLAIPIHLYKFIEEELLVVNTMIHEHNTEKS